MSNSRKLTMSWFKGNGLLPDAPKGKSYDKAYQDQKAAGYNFKRVKEGHKVKTVEVPYYNIEKPKATTIIQQVAAPAPAPVAAPPPPKEPEAPSDALVSANDYLSNYKKSGSNFERSTLSDREELTDSYKQTPSYDPNAGISSPEAGNFLDDYKVNLKNKIGQFKTDATSGFNPSKSQAS